MSINTLSEEVLLVGPCPLENAKTKLQFQDFILELEPQLQGKLAGELAKPSSLALKGYYYYLIPQRWGWKAKLVAILFSDI